MVKILHAADFHLDSAFSSLRPEQARQRRQESREEVRRLVDYANDHGVELLLLSGDLFDSDSAFCETGEMLREALGAFIGPVVIAPGNHDCYTDRSAYARLVWPDNVHCFTRDSVEQFDFPELSCTVYGAAFTAGESSAQVLSGFSVPEDGKTHLMVLHGDTDSPNGPYRPLTKEAIAATGLDYLALGHIHQYRGVQRAGHTAYAYPGCLMGRGFDELGEKGFLTGTVDTGSASLEFVPFAHRRYQICTVEVTDQTALAAAEQTLPPDTQDDSYRLIFTGETEEELSVPALLHALEDRFYSLEIRDETRMKQDIWQRAGEDSLRGLFLREMYEKFRQADESDRETIEKAVRFGLAAMDHRDL
jgi:exonuclease SbcD